jgi:hypothetical protein
MAKIGVSMAKRNNNGETERKINENGGSESEMKMAAISMKAA